MSLKSSVISKSPLFEAMRDPKKLDKMVAKLERAEEAANKAIAEAKQGRTLAKMEKDAKKLKAQAEKLASDAAEKAAATNAELEAKTLELTAKTAEIMSTKNKLEKEQAIVSQKSAELEVLIKKNNDLLVEREAALVEANTLKQEYASKLASLKKFLKANI